MRIRYTVGARRDLDDVVAFVSRESPQAARKVRRAVLDAIELVAARPHLGIKNVRAPELRSRLVSRYPYRVHYFVQGAEIWIVHLRHTSRRPWEPGREE